MCVQAVYGYLNEVLSCFCCMRPLQDTHTHGKGVGGLSAFLVRAGSILSLSWFLFSSFVEWIG